MLADFAQHVDIIEVGQPIIVVDHDRVGRPVAKSRNRSNTLRIDAMFAWIVRGQQFAAFVLAAGVADLGRPAAHQHDRRCPACCIRRSIMICTRLPTWRRRRGGVEPDIARHLFLGGKRVEPCGVGHLVNVSTLVEELEQAAGIGHRARP